MPFKTEPSVPNITSPLPHCMLLSELNVFDSYFPSPSCGHVSPSPVPPLHVCVVCPELLGGAWGFWRADHISNHLLTSCWSCYDPTPDTVAVLQSASLSSLICKTPEKPQVPKIHSFDLFSLPLWSDSDQNSSRDLNLQQKHRKMNLWEAFDWRFWVNSHLQSRDREGFTSSSRSWREEQLKLYHVFQLCH